MAQANRSVVGILLAVGGVLLSGAFLSNITFGIIEVPDNLPFIGNVDEVIVSAIFFSCLSYLGINVIPGTRSKREDANVVEGRVERLPTE